jgi:hypothetical protein
MDYEVTDLFEVGEAGATIRDQKGSTDVDEFAEPLGIPREAFEDE